MAVIFRTSATAGVGTSSTLSASLTSTGTNRKLVVGVIHGAGQTITTAKHGGTNMVPINSGTNGSHRWAYYYFDDPPTGSTACTFTFSGVTYASMAVMCVDGAKAGTLAHSGEDVNASSNTSSQATASPNFLFSFQAYHSTHFQFPTVEWSPSSGLERAGTDQTGAGNDIWGLRSASANTSATTWSEQEVGSNHENVLMVGDIDNAINPEIECESPVSTIRLDGATNPFGNVNKDATQDITIRIKNIQSGSTNLEIETISTTGTFDSVQANQSDADIAALGNADHVVRLDTTTVGAQSFAVSIPNNDPDGGEDPYNITVTYTVIAVESSTPKMQPMGIYYPW